MIVLVRFKQRNHEKEEEMKVHRGIDELRRERVKGRGENKRMRK